MPEKNTETSILIQQLFSSLPDEVSSGEISYNKGLYAIISEHIENFCKENNLNVEFKLSTDQNIYHFTAFVSEIPYAILYKEQNGSYIKVTN